MNEMRVNDWIRRSILCGLDVEPWGMTPAGADRSVRRKMSADFVGRAMATHSAFGVCGIRFVTVDYGMWCMGEERVRALRHGFFRYNRLGHSSHYACVRSADDRIALYRSTGNLAHLVDAVNLIEIEWLMPQDRGEFPLTYTPIDRYLLDARSALAEYESTGNRWLLLRAAGCVLVEWCEPDLEGAYFRPTTRDDRDDAGGVPEV